MEQSLNIDDFIKQVALFFLTLVTYNRYPYFSSSDHISLLRQAIRTVKQEMSCDILGAVILPNHLHFLWQLPSSDSAYLVLF